MPAKKELDVNKDQGEGLIAIRKVGWNKEPNLVSEHLLKLDREYQDFADIQEDGNMQYTLCESCEAPLIGHKNTLDDKCAWNNSKTRSAFGKWSEHNVKCMTDMIGTDSNITIGYMKADRRLSKRKCIKPECKNEATSAWENYLHMKEDHETSIDGIYHYLRPLYFDDQMKREIKELKQLKIDDEEAKTMRMMKMIEKITETQTKANAKVVADTLKEIIKPDTFTKPPEGERVTKITTHKSQDVPLWGNKKLQTYIVMLGNTYRKHPSQVDIDEQYHFDKICESIIKTNDHADQADIVTRELVEKCQTAEEKRWREFMKFSGKNMLKP